MDTDMDRALAELIRISRKVGADPSLVQGGGGNTSVKTADGNWIYIKASGAALKDMSEQAGWRRLRISGVRAILDDPSLAAMEETAREDEIGTCLLACCEDEVAGEARPSVESHLHAALGRCVVHLHPTVVGAYVCAKNGQAELARLFESERTPPLWVPYANPGYTLAKSVARLVREYEKRHGRKPAVLFLQKHGLLVTAETAPAVLKLVHDVINACKCGLRSLAAPRGAPPAPAEITAAQLAVRRALWEAAGARLAVRHFLNEDIAAFLALPEARRLASAAALSPDELACAQGPAVWVERWDSSALARKLQQQIARGERPALSYLGRRVGLVVAGTDRSIPAIRDMVVSSLVIRARSAAFGGPNALTARQRDFIAKWEGENFRRALLAGATGGDLGGQIALVTGAGSGLGRAIAIGLARAGALVALADIEVKAAEETAAIIRKELPGAPVLPVRCDVTEEAAVDRSCEEILRRWGGLDILVNAAGIAPAHALVDLPVDQWRRALEINLTGYFLMARAAARIMIRQGMGGSIVNLSSKSGLEASRSNTAYNATKAGEIHMARGWALELGEHGIRVNAVAPGNVFQGSKIWNPEYLRACAKKYGIKPEEVIPYYVNMTALKREITGEDVADAVVFLCSDRARTITGQTLVADGGQVMVR